MPDPVELLPDPGPKEISIDALFAEIGRLTFINNLLRGDVMRLTGDLNAERLKGAIVEEGRGDD